MSIKKSDIAESLTFIHATPSSRYSRINSDTAYELENLDSQTTPQLNRRQDESRRGTTKVRKLVLVIAAVSILWHGLITLLTFIIILGQVVGQVAVSYYASTPTGECMTDGKFYVGGHAINLWSPSGIFQINLAFGALSFSNAKLVDIIWDVMVGRGGQSILAYVIYKIATKALARSMESVPITFDTFIAVTMQPSSINGSIALLKDYFRNSATRARIMIVWMLLSFAYVLVFPTLISAMTGYTPNLDPYVVLHTGEQVGWSDFRTTTYIIHDGSRIGRTDELILTNLPTEDSGSTTLEDQCLDLYGSFDIPDCALRHAVSLYVWTWSLDSLKDNESVVRYDQNSTFAIQNSTGYNVTTIDLQPPLLNISVYAQEPETFGIWVMRAFNLSTGIFHKFDSSGNDLFASINRGVLFSCRNQTYDVDYLNGHGVCQQSSSFAWGFSFIFLFIVIFISIIWLTAAVVFWIDAYLCSFMDRSSRTIDLCGAAVELTNALDPKLKKELSVEYQTRHGADKDLRRRVAERLAQPEMEYRRIGFTPEVTMSRRDILKEWVTRKRYGEIIWRWRFWIIGLYVISDIATIGCAMWVFAATMTM